jgi:hypothetical protein
MLFFQIPYFEDVGTMTLQFMDTLFQRDNLQKSQFFKGLVQVVEVKKVNSYLPYFASVTNVR